MKKTFSNILRQPILFFFTVLVIAGAFGLLVLKAQSKRVDPAQGLVDISTVPQITSVGVSIDALTITGLTSLVLVDSSGNASMASMPSVATNLGLGPLATLTPTGTAAAGYYLNGIGVYTILPTVTIPTINNGVSRSIVTSTASTGFQISSTRQTTVRYSINTSTTATISGPSSATVYLETAATNSTTPSDWTIVAKVSNGQTLTLAIVLQSVQSNELEISGMVPVGYYVRIRSVTSGTASATYDVGQEIIW